MYKIWSKIGSVPKKKKNRKLEIIGQSAYQGFLYTDRSTKGLFQPFVSRFLKICYLLNFIFGANSFPNVFPDKCIGGSQKFPKIERESTRQEHFFFF